MAEHPRLDAVLFDAGGTLVRIDFEWISAMLAELGLTVSAADVRAAEVLGRRRYDSSTATGATRPVATPQGLHPPLGSTGDTMAYFSGMLEGAGVRHPVLEEALHRMVERGRPPTYLWGRAMEGAREAIDGLLALGLRTACVSNSDGRAERHLIDCGVREGLEFVVDSQVVGIEKPDPRIFALALRQLGVPPERALYVGDIRSVDERGAEAAGMAFVLVDASGSYAAAGAPRIGGLAELPAHVAQRFDLSHLQPPSMRRS